MSVSASSTLQEVQQAYDNNADYDVTGIVSKARDFIVACRILLRRLASQQASEGHSVGLQQNLTEISKQMNRATTWLEANGGSSGSGPSNVRTVSFEDFR